jgi:hypothetical protein
MPINANQPTSLFRAVLRDVSNELDSVRKSEIPVQAAHEQLKELIERSAALTGLLGSIGTDKFEAALLDPANRDKSAEVVLKELVLPGSAAGQQRLHGDMAPDAVAPHTPARNIGYGDEPHTFRDDLIAQLRLPDSGVKPDEVKLIIGGHAKSLTAAIRDGDELSSQMLRDAGVDQWNARNIVLSIQDKSTDDLGLESLHG